MSIVCDGRVNAENNASVTIGGNTYTFTIDFEGEVLAIDFLRSIVTPSRSHSLTFAVYLSFSLPL